MAVKVIGLNTAKHVFQVQAQMQPGAEKFRYRISKATFHSA